MLIYTPVQKNDDMCRQVRHALWNSKNRTASVHQSSDRAVCCAVNEINHRFAEKAVKLICRELSSSFGRGLRGSAVD